MILMHLKQYMFLEIGIHKKKTSFIMKELFGIKNKWNKIPEGAINETGNYPIDYRIQQIKNCNFFICNILYRIVTLFRTIH